MDTSFLIYLMLGAQSFKLGLNIFWNFTSYTVWNSKFMPLLHRASLRLNQPLNLVACLCEYFPNINNVSSRKKVVVCLDLFLSKQCLYKWGEYDSLTPRSVLHETILNYFCVIPPHKHCLYCRSCRKVDKFFSTVSERESIDTWIVVNFFYPMTADNFLSPTGFRDCFRIITYSCINKNMVNPKIFSFLSRFFCSTNR